MPIRVGDIVLRNWSEQFPMKMGVVTEITGNGLFNRGVVRWFEWEVRRLLGVSQAHGRSLFDGQVNSFRLYDRRELVLYDKTEI